MTPPKQRRALSTGEVARVSGVSQQTVIRCFDRGDMRGFRVPMSRWRRVPVAEVVRWAERHGLTLDWTTLTEGEE